jgi:beta-lactamase class D
VTASPPASPPAPAIDWDAHFGGLRGCFIGRSARTGAVSQNDPKRCQTRFPPFSTFKIANALIGLDTGVLAGPDTVIDWDRAAYPPQPWWPKDWDQRHDLRSAFARSVVPYFQTLAVRVGAPTMATYVAKLGYGNTRTGPRVDTFWLSGDLAISAAEQIAFLQRLHDDALPVSPRAMAVVRDIMVRDRTDAYVIRAKTGTGPLSRDGGDRGALGWYVGWVETADDVYYFALNVSAPEMSDIPWKLRIDMTRRILVALGVLPSPA